ncbi:MAG: acetate--CoA ligase [Chitinophagales bacterium]
MAHDDKLFETLLNEERSFPPPPALAATARARDPELYASAARDPEAFWAEQAAALDWFRLWDRVLDWDNPPFARWFVGGRLNASYNCLDRHLGTWRRNKAALLWEGEPGESRVLTYQDLHREVCRCANALRRLGVTRGDRVTLYLPMIPELVIAMLACARLGAAHSVVFAGYSVEALRDRLRDAGSNLVVTADGGYRRGNVVPLKRNVDDALAQCPEVRTVLVVRRTEAADDQVRMVPGRDHWWHEALADAPLACEPEEMDAEDLLFVLYTSGTTGRPKGVVHTTGGYLTGAHATTKYIFDLKDDDVYFCTADIGWITGHSYVVYGPLSNGATVLIYEGAPDFPARDRFWELIEKYRATIFYTAPTAIRSFMRWGPHWPGRHDLSSLRLLGTVGEPINPEAWLWFHRYIGGERCPIVDTWWQTETGAIMVSPLPGLTPTKPGSAAIPFPGIEAEVVDGEGRPVPPGKGGYLVIRRPWPSMLRNIYGDPERFKDQYWSRFPGVYFTGDGARRDADGYLWVLGRVDDVLKVSGHRIGTMEVESALVGHPDVAEAAVIGRPHEVKGQAITAFVTLKEAARPSPALAQQLRDHVSRTIGPIARPDEVIFTTELPKTRSGKIMRRLLRDLAEHRTPGDTSTLADPGVFEELKSLYEAEEAAG